MPELVSLREYARRRGVSAPAVSKAAKTGRITLVDGKVDVESANRDWPANTNPGQMALKAGPIDSLGAANGTEELASREADGPLEATPETRAALEALSSRSQYGAARATREMYLSRLAEIDYKQQTGSLVDAAEVRALAFKAARGARDSLLTIPDRLAPILAGESDQFEVHRLLSAELRRVCDDLAAAKLL